MINDMPAAAIALQVTLQKINEFVYTQADLPDYCTQSTSVKFLMIWYGNCCSGF
jgi:hypothetical protein